MNSKYTFYAMLAAVVALVVFAGGITYEGLGLLHKKGDELMSLKVKQETLASRKTALANAKRDVATYAPLEAIGKSIVPQEKDQARTVREIVNIAGQTGVPLGSIEFPTSTLGDPKQKTGSTSSSAAPVKKVPLTDPTTTQLTVVPDIKGLYTMDVTIQSTADQPVPYSKFLTFLGQLEKNRATANVTNLTIQPNEKDRNLVTFSVILNVYIKP